MSLNAPGYRPDIDGLRAVAVLAVVLYHFGAGFIAGGFVGVDVFFVISGFLITGIVAREVQDGTFTFLKFYERRARRLFPALFVMLVISSILAWRMFLPSDLMLFGKSSIASVLFSSNLFFWLKIGYFDFASTLNPLLHTWSLAVEEQFYLLFPVFLLVSLRLSPRAVVPLVWLVVLATFAICVVVQWFRPTATFYLTPFRAWEFGLGALLALGAVPTINDKGAREFMAASGAALLIGSLCLVSAGRTFPGWHAMFPALGTALVVHAGSSGATAVGRFLSQKPLVFFGLISYSLYLWHWPVHVFALYSNGLRPLGLMSVPLVVISIVLAYASYRWVETPVRRGFGHAKLTRPVLFASSAAAMAGLCVLGMTFVLAKGLPERFPPGTAALDRQRDVSIPYSECTGAADKAASATSCRLGSAEIAPTYALWGDSHALAIAPAVHQSLLDIDAAGHAFINPGCPSLVGMRNPNHPKCHLINATIFDWIEAHPTVRNVILHNYWASYFNNQAFYSASHAKASGKAVIDDAYVTTLNRLEALNVEIIVIGAIPGSTTTPLDYIMAKRTGSPLEPPTRARDHSNRAHRHVAITSVAMRSSRRLHFVDPASWFCNDRECTYGENDQIYYRDEDHLSLMGAAYVAPLLTATLLEIRASGRQVWIHSPPARVTNADTQQ